MVGTSVNATEQVRTCRSNSVRYRLSEIAECHRWGRACVDADHIIRYTQGRPAWLTNLVFFVYILEVDPLYDEMGDTILRQLYLD